MRQQLKEELYQAAERKLKLEQEMGTIEKLIKTLKKELAQRMPGRK
jgi:hypothetical protein